VIVCNLDIVSIRAFPPEAHAPLIVRPDAVLASPIAFELLEAVATWDTQIVQPIRRIKYQKLAQHPAVQIRRETPGSLSREDPGGIPVGEAADHIPIITPRVTRDKRNGRRNRQRDAAMRFGT
jgi:hypothetical protein